MIIFGSQVTSINPEMRKQVQESTGVQIPPLSSILGEINSHVMPLMEWQTMHAGCCQGRTQADVCGMTADQGRDAESDDEAHRMASASMQNFVREDAD